METLDIDVTYYEYERLTELDEADCHRHSLRWELPLQQVALVLVDVWSEHYIQTHLERATWITRERIVRYCRPFASWVHWWSTVPARIAPANTPRS